ncbi:MAG TPA: hypothetical protein DCW86_03015 [Actinobacteria bacterium]|nr:hypothetical protein [Actinomycetota bacterium]
MKKHLIGVDIGGTKIMGGVVDDGGNLLTSLKKPTPTTNARVLIEAVKEVIGELLTRDPGVLGTGLGVAGLVDWEEGMVTFSPNLPLKGVPLREEVRSFFGLPTFVDNDANVAALGECRYGAGERSSNLVFIILGTGIGGGIIVDGKIYRGTRGYAGEIGHMVIDPRGPLCGCGNHGCLEALASGQAIAVRAREAVAGGRASSILELAGGKVENITAKTVTTATGKGDVLGREILSEAGRMLGIGLANLVNVFDPEIIIAGGGLAEAGELILGPAREELEKRVMSPDSRRVEIVQAKLGAEAGVIGAATMALEGIGGAATCQGSGSNN